MRPAGVWGETPPRGVQICGQNDRGKNIKNYSSNIKYLRSKSILFSIFAIEKEMIDILKQRHFRKVGREHNPNPKVQIKPKNPKVMKQETKEMLLKALANNHPHVMGDDYYVSIQIHWGEDYEVILFPNERYRFWTGWSITYMLSYEYALNIRMAIESKHGVSVISFR